MIALKVALVPVVFDPFGADAFGVAKSIASRAGMYLLLCTGLTLLMLCADARRRMLRSQAIIAGLFGFGAVALLATILAIDHDAALFGVNGRYLGLTSIADALVLAGAIPLFVARPADLRWVYGGLFGGAIVVLAYAVVQLVGLDPIVRADGDPFTSTFGNRGPYAGYLVVIAAAGACVALLGERKWALLIGPISLAAAILVVRSDARAAILAMPPALLFAGAMALAAGRRPPIRDRALFAGLALIVVMGLLAVVSVAGPRLATLRAGGDPSLAERTIVYEAALTMIAARPLLGGGPDSFAVLYPTVRPLAAALTPGIALGQTSAHSWPLHQAVGTGLLGVAVLALLTAGSLRRALAPSRGASHEKVGATIVVAFLLKGVFEIPDVATEYLFWTGIGLAAAGPFVAEEEPTTTRNVGWPSIAAVLVPCAVGLLLASTTVNWLEANRAVRASDVLRAAGKLEAAERAALVATQRDPGRANNWNVLGLARSLVSPQRALAAFERAWAEAPYESRYLINMVKEESRIAEGNAVLLERMRTHALKAVEIDPRNAETRVVLSFALLRTGDYLGARREADLVIAFAPNDPQSYAWSSVIHEETGDFAGAAERYYRHVAMTATGEISGGQKLKLARLYVRAGLMEQARSLGQPRVVGATKVCDSRCSQVAVRFESPLGLATDGPGNARDPRRYLIDGHALPPGAVISLDGLTLSIVGPPQTDLVRSGSVISIAGLTDDAGIPTVPDPITIVVP